ncbi:hypothetical protein Leryth_017320 [Lithospermum erythrorhizon]|nr:hypothetical protein Leryth_017320 [Lithospermum erythrorhizon]
MGISIPLMILNLLFLGSENVNLIDNTCKNTPNYNLCISVFLEDPRSSSADIRGLGLIVIDALKSKAEETANFIDTLKTTSPGLRSPLNRCAILYFAVLKADIPEAVEALSKGVPKFAEDGVADAALEAQSCELAFGSASNSPLTDLNKSVVDLSNVARSIIRMLL